MRKRSIIRRRRVTYSVASLRRKHDIIRDMPHPAIFQRTELMLGTAMLDTLKATKVAVSGLGGVGSWCA